MGKRQAKPEIVVTVTRLAPNSDRERAAGREARLIWRDAYIKKMVEEIGPLRVKRVSQRRKVTHHPA